jgi:hypothetical protein
MDQLAAPSDKRSQFRAPWLWLDPFAVRLVPADVAVRLSCEMSAEGPLRLVSTTIQSGKPGTTSELPLTCGPEGAVYRYDWKQDVGGRVWSAEGCFYVEPVLPTLAAARDVLRRAGRLLVSDGVTEAFSPQGEAFGRARLAALFAECRAHSATETARRIDEALSTHRGYQAPLDDTTLVAIEFTLPAAERIGTQQAPFHRLTGEQPVRNQLVALGLASSAETRKTQRITGSRGPGRTTGADRCG